MQKMRYHSGKLVVVQEGDKWIATIKAPDGTLTVELQSNDADNAVLEAEQLYADNTAVTSDAPLCWQCIHWKPAKAECSLGVPEGKRSGGRFAAQCSYYWSN